MRGPDTVGLIVERIRKHGMKDTHRWYCEKCNNVLFEKTVQIEVLERDMPPVFEAYYGDPDNQKCKTCGHVNPGRPKRGDRALAAERLTISRPGRAHSERIRHAEIRQRASRRPARRPRRLHRRRAGQDVTRHPAFRNAAQSIAAFYDLKADPARRDQLTYEENGERHSIYYMKARNRDELAKRSDAHRILAEPSYGFLGRSPDYFASFVTGANLKPDLFGRFADNVRAYYAFMRDRDIFAAHAIVSPQAARDPAFYQRMKLPNPSCRVVREEDDGVVVSGMKMLATGAILADEIWIGNILPLAPEAKAESITFAVPCNTPGVSLWSRKPFEPQVRVRGPAHLALR